MEYTQQRRKTTRVDLSRQWDVTIETPDGPPLAGRVRNVSQGGVGLELAADRAFQPGEELILQVVANPAQRLFATARVIWARPQPAGAQDVGLEWTNSGPTRERLEALVATAVAPAAAATTRSHS